jgi:hypothetical protein
VVRLDPVVRLPKVVILVSMERLGTVEMLVSMARLGTVVILESTGRLDCVATLEPVVRPDTVARSDCGKARVQVIEAEAVSSGAPTTAVNSTQLLLLLIRF